MNSYPECSFKGSDTRLILQFVIWKMEQDSVVLDEIAKTALIAAKAMDDFLRHVFGAHDERGCRKPLLLRHEGALALSLLSLYLERFYMCAQLCFGRRLCFFVLTPKFHYLMHVAHDLTVQLNRVRDGEHILNPALFATQMAEDATGRSCRMARTVHVLTSSMRVAQKWLIAAKLFWDKEQNEVEKRSAKFCEGSVCIYFKYGKYSQ